MSNNWIGKTRKQICKEFNLSEEEFYDILEQYDFAFCDKCERVYSSYDLNWITADSFGLKSGEYLREKVFKKYDCLCEECFKEEEGDELKHIVKDKIEKIKEKKK